MGFIPRITCRRCGRPFSGLRSRCPYCGTRRVKQSERAPAPTPGEDAGSPAGARAAVNTRWQLIFGAILLVAVILAVIVLVSVSLNGTAQSSPTVPVTSFTPPPAATPSPSPTPEPTPTIESLGIYCWNTVVESDFTESVGTQVPLTVQAYPTTINIDEAVTWSSSDETIATVVKDETGTGCMVTIVGAGRCTITVTVYGASTSVDAIGYGG